MVRTGTVVVIENQIALGVDKSFRFLVAVASTSVAAASTLAASTLAASTLATVDTLAIAS